MKIILVPEEYNRNKSKNTTPPPTHTHTRRGVNLGGLCGGI